jgi:uncharacterized protein YjbI with pentapeptide repeats
VDSSVVGYDGGQNVRDEEHPVAREKSRWWLPRRTALRIVPALVMVGIGALLFVVSSQYVATLSNRILLVLGVATVLATVVVLIRVGQSYEWTGFGESVQPKQDNQEIQPRKTLWDWLELLIVPVALASIGLWFTVQQDARQQEIQQQNAQDDALQAYLDQMSTLMLGKNNLRDSEVGSEERILTRARTLTVLARLDTADRKNSVMRFLEESSLIQKTTGRSSPVISLDGADLHNTDLRHADLHGAVLGAVAPSTTPVSVYMVGVEGVGPARSETSHPVRAPYRADLSGAKLMFANLRNADLHGADLRYADLSNADLRDANLNHAHLSGANLSNTDLSGANLKHANLSEVDLSYSNVHCAASTDEAWGGTKDQKTTKHLDVTELHGSKGLKEADRKATCLEGSYEPGTGPY